MNTGNGRKNKKGFPQKEIPCTDIRIMYGSLRWHYPNQVLRVEVPVLPLSLPGENATSSPCILVCCRYSIIPAEIVQQAALHPAHFSAYFSVYNFRQNTE